MTEQYLMQRDYDDVDLQSVIEEMHKMIKKLKVYHEHLTVNEHLRDEVNRVFKDVIRDSERIAKLLAFKIHAQQKLDRMLAAQITKFMQTP